MKTNAPLVQIGAGDFPVLARDLHRALGVRKKYADWWRQQVRHLDMHDGISFEPLIPLEGKKTGRPREDHEITVRAAKHIAMKSGTAKGVEVREYFLECERRVHAPLAITPSQAGDLAGLLTANVEAIRKLSAFATAETARADSAEDTVAVMEPAFKASEARSRAKIHVSTSDAWRSVMGRRKLTDAVWELFYAKLFKKTAAGYVWRKRFVDLDWGCDDERVYDGRRRESARWFELGRLALPLWMTEQDRQAELELELPSRLLGDRQARLPEGATR